MEEFNRHFSLALDALENLKTEIKIVESGILMLQAHLQEEDKEELYEPDNI